MPLVLPLKASTLVFSGGLVLTGLTGGKLPPPFDHCLFVESKSGMWTHLYQVRVTEGRENPNKSV